jgi:Uma2 family endonuclease
MNIAHRTPLMTVPEYLAWGEVQNEHKHTQLINGQVVVMSPESADHIRLKGRVYLALHTAVRAEGLANCEAFTDGMTVPIDMHTAYEPDALVHCGAPIPPRQLAAPNPIIIVEVISPSSAHIDTSAKLIGYFKLPSVMHYLVIDPDARALTHHQRQADGSVAARTLATGPLRLAPPGLELQVAELFGP